MFWSIKIFISYIYIYPTNIFDDQNIAKLNLNKGAAVFESLLNFAQ